MPRPSARRSRQRAQEEVLFATDLLPGVGEDEVSLGQAVRIGGVSTFVVLLLLRSLEELESSTLSVLAPDLRHTFGVSDGTIVFLAAASGAFLVLGALPMGWMADRYRRPPVIGWANLAFAAFLTALRCGDQRVPAVLGAARRWHREVELDPGAGIDDRRRVSDQSRVGASTRGWRWARASSASSARSSSPASPPRSAVTTGGAGRSCCWGSRLRWSRCSPSSCRSRPGVSSRSRTCSAKSSRTSSPRRSRSRPRSPVSGRSGRSRPSSSHSRPSASASSPCRC